jgi:hypothetical protein
VVQDVLRGTVTVDRAGLQGRDGLRTALGVGVPLLVGVAVDRPLDGLAAAGGAFAAGFALFANGYRTRLSAVLLPPSASPSPPSSGRRSATCCGCSR